VAVDALLSPSTAQPNAHVPDTAAVGWPITGEPNVPSS
jgi:hypothetical protein